MNNVKAGKGGRRKGKAATKLPEPERLPKLHFLGGDYELDVPAPPEHLSDESKEQWTVLVDEYGFEAQSLLVLMTALESYDRMRQAQEQITMNGMTYLDRFGQTKPRPEIQIERDSRAAYWRGLKELGLNLETIRSGPGRPPGR